MSYNPRERCLCCCFFSIYGVKKVKVYLHIPPPRPSGDGFPFAMATRLMRAARGWMMVYLQFPAWQSLCWEAVGEFDFQKLLVRIDRAEAAVLHRANQLKNSATEDDEQLAIGDAFISLQLLRRLYDNRPLRASQ